MIVDNLVVNMRNKLENKFPKIKTYLFFVSFTIYLVSQYIGGTLIPSDYKTVFIVITVASIIIMGKIIVFDDYPILAKLLIIAIWLILFAAGKNSYDYNMYYYSFYIFGEKDIDLKKILRWYLVIISLSVAITTIIAILHIIPTLSVGRSNSAVLRLSMGAIYPSDLAARIFYLMLGYIVIKKFSLSLPEYISLISITITTYVVTDTKLDLILMIMLVLSAIFYKYISKILDYTNNIVLNLTIILFIFINLFLAYIYNPNNFIFKILDKALTGRLYFGHVGFKDYNVTLYGQYVYQNGWGGIHKAVTNYFYIDSSWVRVLLMQGAIVYLFILWLVVRNTNNFLLNKKYGLLIALLFVVISSAIDQHLLELSYNFMFLATFANSDYFRCIYKK